MSESEIGFSVVVVNMPSENFKDAWFFLNQAGRETDVFKIRQYLRASCVFFCASVESWYNKMIAYHLERKNNKSSEEVKLYEFLTDNEADYFHKNVNTSLKKYLPEAIGKDPSTLNQDTLDKYRELTELRNRIAHYTPVGFNAVYDTNQMFTLLQTAPQLLRDLISMYEPVSPNHWVSQDYSDL